MKINLKQVNADALCPGADLVPGLLWVSAGGRGAVAGGEELLDGEADLGEDLAGVVVAAAAGAFLLGHAVIVGRDEQLGVALKADDGELAEGDVQPAAGVGGDQRLAEAGEDAGRDVVSVVVAADVAVGVYELEVQR